MDAVEQISFEEGAPCARRLSGPEALQKQLTLEFRQKVRLAHDKRLRKSMDTMMP